MLLTTGVIVVRLAEVRDPANKSIINRETLLAIIELARYAPSGDNCQPWRFRPGANRLEVFYSYARGEHALNNNQHANCLALGTLLEAISLASSRYGYESSAVVYKPEATAGQTICLVAQIDFSWSGRTEDPLCGFLESRATDRRLYTGEPLDDGSKEALLALNEGESCCSLGVKGDFSEAFLDYLLRSDEFMWEHPPVLKDLGQWLRFDKTSCETSRDGMSWQNLGLQKHERGLFQFLLRHPRVFRGLWSLGFRRKVNKMSLQQIQGSAALFTVFLKTKAPDDLVSAGRMAMRAWLLLTQQGWSVQPLALSSLTAFDFVTGHAPAYAKKDFFQHYSAGVALYRQEFKMDPAWTPVWGFRIGKPLPGTQLHRTKRLSVQELLMD
jgi:hypothetical protein